MQKNTLYIQRAAVGISHDILPFDSYLKAEERQSTKRGGKGKSVRPKHILRPVSRLFLIIFTCSILKYMQELF